MPKQERKSTSVRLTPEAVRLIEALAGELGVNQSAVIELAVRCLAKAEKIGPVSGREGGR
ncbi:MAG: ribbon-helix-helix protein, CopG family [Phaeospirillum sp.]|nr:ribbon-helix-helix protein, CopG family [Phaeospirillum sp.]